MKQVCDDHDPIIVTRKNNEAVILMSLEDYESLNYWSRRINTKHWIGYKIENNSILIAQLRYHYT